MPSPFPGMDPYLEGYLWPDLHDALAHKIRQALAPQIQPSYVARLNISMVEDESYEAEIGVMYPDVEVVKSRGENVAGPAPFAGTMGATVGTIAGATVVAPPAPLTITLPQVRLVSVEIRDVAANELVTSIEILSPINKREPHLTRYRQKRERFRRAQVHLLEIDLLRRGTRVWEVGGIPSSPYVIMLTRAATSEMAVWPLALTSELPILPVPLRVPDDDAVLNLQEVFEGIYDEAYYRLSVDYTADPPPPDFTDEQREWIRQTLED